MTIIKADVLGYCMGVKRAVESAEKALEEADGRQVFTLGPLIHNPSVLSHFESEGIKVLSSDNLSNLPESSTVIIRAHGTTPEVMKSLENRGAEVVDSTCPRVHLSQKRAREWSEKGYEIIIAGDRNHGEITGILGYISGSSVVIQNREDAVSLKVPEKAVLLSQTTFSLDEFNEIEKILKEKNPELVVFNSVCSATMERQKALKALKGKADGIIVIGGKNSSNTRRLYQIAESICSKAALIENEKEIPEEFYGLNTVAITAGASTPDFIIEKVEDTLIKKGELK